MRGRYGVKVWGVGVDGVDGVGMGRATMPVVVGRCAGRGRKKARCLRRGGPGGRARVRGEQTHDMRRVGCRMAATRRSLRCRP